MGLGRQAKIGFKGTQKFSNGKILYVFSALFRKNMGIWVPAICIINLYPHLCSSMANGHCEATL